MSQEKILVVALLQRGKLPAATYELMGVGQSLSQTLKQPLAAVVLGAQTDGFAQDLIARGAQKVFTVQHPSLEVFNDELHSKAVADLAKKEGFGKILIASTVAGRALVARLAVLLKAGLAPDAAEVYQNGTGFKAKRPLYNGNVISEVEFKAPVQIVTVQPMVFPPAPSQAERKGEVSAIPFEPGSPRVEVVSFQKEESGEVDLGAAERIVSGGRGLGQAEGFKLLYELAHTINAAVGASRAVVDAGWIAYRHQVGLTGRNVRPKLYIACGISGQVQHLAGMSASGTIVAINTDAQCPMMQLASISVAADVNEIVPLIIAEVKKRRGAAV